MIQVFAMLSFWVESGAFEQIEIGFLPVGHTHNEPDQAASRCSVCCRNRDIPTRERLLFRLHHQFDYIVCDKLVY